MRISTFCNMGRTMENEKATHISLAIRDCMHDYWPY